MRILLTVLTLVLIYLTIRTTPPYGWCWLIDGIIFTLVTIAIFISLEIGD